MKKIFSALIFICLLAATLIIIFYPVKSDKNSEQKTKAKPVPLVKTVSAKNKSMAKRLELTGSVQAYRIAQLASPAEGPVQDLKVREGDIVETDTQLMSIGRKKGIDALISSLRDELKRDEEEYNRVKLLVEKGVFPVKNLEAARATLNTTKARLATAEQELQDYSIKAPWRGIVSNLKVQEGDFVIPRSPLVEIYDPTTLIARAAVPERNAANMKLEMPVEVMLDAYPNKKFDGRISRLYPYLDQRLRTRIIEIEIINSPPLLPGMFVRINLMLDNIDGAIAVPDEAILTSPKGDKMIVLLKDGKASRKKVITGVEDSGWTQIISGLSEGEEVIIEGHEKLKDGVEVRLAGQKKTDKPIEKTKQNTANDQEPTKPLDFKK